MYNIFIKSLYLCAKNRFLKRVRQSRRKSEKNFPPGGFIFAGRVCTVMRLYINYKKRLSPSRKSRNFTRQVLPLARPRRKNGQRSVVKMLFKLCARTLFGQNLYKYPLPTRQAHKFCEIILIHGDNARPEFRLPFQAAIYFSSVSQLLS